MSKRIRRLVLAVLALTLVAAAFVLYIWMAPLPRHSVNPSVTVQVDRTPGRVAEGRRLAQLMCEGCHFDPATGAFSGKPITDLPAALGRFYSGNITADKVEGVGAWSEGELAYAIRAGVTRDGSSTLPMPTFDRLSDKDLAVLIAFLRSDDPLVRAAGAHAPRQRPSLIAKFLVRFVLKSKPYPDRAIPVPADDPVELGRYLALDRLHCYACHSASVTSVDEEHPERSPGFFGGGNALQNAGGVTVYSANITPDFQTGIGKWNEEEFARAVRGGLRRNGAITQPPMPMYTGLTNTETKALFAYLRTVPPIRNIVSSGAAPNPAAAGSRGEILYRQYRCGACHGENDVGQYDLTRAVQHLGSANAIEAWIRNPGRYRKDVKMPAWEGVIHDDEYGPLVEYVQLLGRRMASR